MGFAWACTSCAKLVKTRAGRMVAGDSGLGTICMDLAPSSCSIVTAALPDFSPNLFEMPMSPNLRSLLGYLIGGGVLVGLAIGVAVALIERLVDDGPIEIVISILVPYAAYLIGARAHASGVIAVIACGMYMSRKSPGVHVTASTVTDHSSMGRIDVRFEWDCVCADRTATSVCDEPDWWSESDSPAGIWGRL